MKKREYDVSGRICKVYDNAILIEGKQGKIKLHIPEGKLAGFKWELGRGICVRAKGSPPNREVVFVLSAKQGFICSVARKQKTKKVKEMAKTRELKRDEPVVVQGKSSYNGSMPAMRSGKSKGKISRAPADIIGFEQQVNHEYKYAREALEMHKKGLTKSEIRRALDGF